MVLGKNSNSKTHSFVIYYDELWFKKNPFGYLTKAGC